MSRFNYGEIPIGAPPLENAASSKENHINRRKLLIDTAIFAFSSVVASSAGNSELIKNLKYFINSEQREKNEPEENSIENFTPKENHPKESDCPTEMYNLAIEIRTLAHQIEKKEHLLPKKLFTKNFFIAVQIQESNLEKNAESQAGAIGIMQVKPLTIKEIVRYLNILERQGEIEFDGPQKIKELSDNDIDDLISLAKSNPSLGKSLGKIYFADLFSNFKIGQDSFLKNDISGARKKLLAAYNWNPKNFKESENNEQIWPAQTQNYYKKILKYMDILEDVQVEMDKLNIQTDIYLLSGILTVELRKYEKEINSKNSNFKKIIQNISIDYLKDIRDMEKIKGQALKSDELKRIIKSSNQFAYKNFLANRS